jgi:formate hydrogenlyase subunit 3/multisubunit Na+/H+ antiporter MnhD subunit
MFEFIGAIMLLLAGGMAAVVFRSRSGLCQTAGQSGAIVGSVLGLLVAVRVLVTGRPETMIAAWPMPGGGLHFQIDALSAFFLLPVFGLSLVTAIYGRSYLASRGGRHGLAGCWFHSNLLTAGMASVIAAHDGLLFLLSWEVMALSPFFLVIFDDRKAAVRHAAWTYLAATHLGTAFLLAAFVMLGQLAGSSDFDAYRGVLQANPGLASLVFILALIGFGSKAGVVPAHVWLPEAHPVAPSPASALMSGAMIKVGIYGLVRMLALLGPPQPWWGGLLIAIGASSGILGVLFAIAQHDLKRLLAYSSVENIGIVLLGIGVGVLGLASGMLSLAVIGFAAGLLHVVNHSIFKGLLFLGAGAVQHGAHSLAFEELGGLLKRMPWTGAVFLIGAAAIVGLPPLNGFVGEFLLFYSGFLAVLQPAPMIAVAGLVSVITMALISGLAAACFAKAFGVVFLGSPRGAEAGEAHEVARSMRAAMALLAVLCIVIGLAAPVIVGASADVVAIATGVAASSVRGQLAIVTGPLSMTVSVFAIWIVVALLAGLYGVHRSRARRAGIGPVWGCGYLFPSAKMQYTASSFVQPLTTQFHLFVRNREALVPPAGYFPTAASYSSDSGDPWLRLLFAPTFRWFDRIVSRLDVLQHGHIHVYVLYVAATLLALLLWAGL